jgi:hypothetical protein
MHEDEQPVDLSPIDPARDGARWDALVASVAARARARRRPSLARELVRRGVPAFALAAAAAALVWLAKPRPRPAPDDAPAPTSRDATDVIATWGLTGGGDAIDLLGAGGDHAVR